MLRNHITLLLLIMTLFSCKNEPPHEGFGITGKFEPTFENQKAKLISFGSDKEVVIDSTIIENGILSLKGIIESPDMYYLAIEGIPGYLPIMIENEAMTVTFYKDSIQKSLVSGSKENDLLKIYQDDSDILKIKNAQFGQRYRVAKEQGDTLRMTEIKMEFNKMLEASNEKHLELIKNNPNLVTSAAILGNMLFAKGISASDAENIFNTFSQEVLISKFGKTIKETLALSTTEVGNIAPDFSAPTPDGTVVSLADLKGKVTIIDFWAAWCGPCRKENPNVVQVYEKYHDKGLEIIGVSLDGAPNQKDAKAAWMQAIEKDKLTWAQVSNLSYFNDPIAKQYNIQAIPATFILDSEGKIVAKNLRGAALEAKVAELLN